MQKIKKGDEVVVITGKDKGKTGKVTAVDHERDRVVVEGVNRMKRHTKPGPMQREGGILEREFPIHVSKVLPVAAKSECPSEAIPPGAQIPPPTARVLQAIMRCGSSRPIPTTQP